MTDWYKLDNPQREAVAKYRDPEIAQEDEILDMFLLHLKVDMDASPQFIAQVKARIDGFLGYRMEDVKAGEAEMLRRWSDR